MVPHCTRSNGPLRPPDICRAASTALGSHAGRWLPPLDPLLDAHPGQRVPSRSLAGSRHDVRDKMLLHPSFRTAKGPISGPAFSPPFGVSLEIQDGRQREKKWLNSAISRSPEQPWESCWCGREDSNFHGLSATTTSTLRVYQFRHDRTHKITGQLLIQCWQAGAPSKGFTRWQLPFDQRARFIACRPLQS